jgi:hypothetical protein
MLVASTSMSAVVRGLDNNITIDILKSLLGPESPMVGDCSEQVINTQFSAVVVPIFRARSGPFSHPLQKIYN